MQGMPARCAMLVGAAAARRLYSSPAATAAALATLPTLDYKYDALAPVISHDIMKLHHTKHHQAYVDNYNKALAQFTSLKDTCQVSDRVALLKALNFNGGGHVNHEIFWKSLVPKASYVTMSEAAPEFAEAVEEAFGSTERLQRQLLDEALGVQGSGWAWLGYDPVRDTLGVATTANQDTLQATHKLIPVLGIDVWEHAYYLDYKNVRKDYLDAVWGILNWREAAKRYTVARQSRGSKK